MEHPEEMNGRYPSGDEAEGVEQTGLSFMTQDEVNAFHDLAGDNDLLPAPGGEIIYHEAPVIPDTTSTVVVVVDEDGNEDREQSAALTELLDSMGYQRPEVEGASATDLVCALDDIAEKIGSIDADIEQAAAIAERRTSVIRDWFEEQVAGPRRRREWLIAEARRISEAARALIFGKKKSRSMPHGVVKFTQGKGSIEIYDEKKAIAFAEKHGIPVQTKKVVSKDDLRAYIDSVGEVSAIDDAGFRLVPSPENFSFQAKPERP